MHHASHLDDGNVNSFSIMVNSDLKRAAFVKNAVAFLYKFGVEGIVNS